MSRWIEIKATPFNKALAVFLIGLAMTAVSLRLMEMSTTQSLVGLIGAGVGMATMIVGVMFCAQFDEEDEEKPRAEIPPK